MLSIHGCLLSDALVGRARDYQASDPDSSLAGGELVTQASFSLLIYNLCMSRHTPLEDVKVN